MAYVGNVTVGATNVVPLNPGPVLIKLRWTDFEQPRQSDLRSAQESNLSIWVNITSGRADAEFQTRYISTLYAQCELEFVRVPYGYHEATQFVAYEVEGMSRASSSMSGVFWGALIWQQITLQVSGHFISYFVYTIH